MIIDEEDYLEHFGVLGMKWGVRKDRETGSERAVSKEIRVKEKREKKAEVFENRAAEAQKQIDALDALTPKTRYQKRSVMAQRHAFVQQRDINKTNAKRKKEGKLTDQQRKILRGAATAAIIVGAYSAYKMTDSGDFHRLGLKGKAALQRNQGVVWDKWPNLKKKDYSVDEIERFVVKQINPDYGSLGASMNCRRCTFAYEMRRRGYDVAATKTVGATGQSLVGLEQALNPASNLPTTRLGAMIRIAKEEGRVIDGTLSREETFSNLVRTQAWGKNQITTSGVESAGAAIRKALSSQPDGARGELGVGWVPGGGHSMAWEIVGGKPIVFDTQTRKTLKSTSEIDAYLNKAGGIAAAGFTRLDNVDLNQDFLMKWLKNAH